LSDIDFMPLSNTKRKMAKINKATFTLVAALFMTGCNRSDSPAQVSPHLPTAAAVTTNAEAASAPFRAWVKGSWDTNSFGSGSRFAREGDARTRALALEKLFSKRQSMSEAELQEFRQLLAEQIRATADDPYVVAASIRTLAGLLDYLKMKKLASQTDIAADGELLVSYMSNGSLNLQVRGAAIRAVGDLGITTGRKSIEAMLSDPANSNTPEIARNGCLAFVKLANEESLMPIRGVFEKTSDSSVFGTAAFCLGQINNAAAMSALVENARRFPDSESCDAALVNMAKTILETLSVPDSADVMNAIQATEHLWKDGQREKYIPALQGLLADNSLAVKRASCERLIDAASRLPLAQEKQELAVVLESIGQSPELHEYAEKIRQRMGATVLIPATASALVPVLKKD
jgi:HEAT repeat protein